MYTQNKKQSSRAIGMCVSGVFQAVVGVLLALIFGISLLVLLVMRPSTVIMLTMFVFFAAGVLLIVRGVRKFQLYRLCQQVMLCMGERSRERLSALTQATHRDYTKLVHDLRVLAVGGIFPGAYVDLNRREFVMIPGGPQPPIVQGNKQLKEKTKPSVAPIYAVGLTFLVYALLFPLYRIMDFLLAAVLAVLVCIVVSRIAKPRIVIVEEARKVEPPKPPEKINTGNSELDEVLTSAMTYMNELTALDVAITNERIDKPVQELVCICRQIFDYIRKHPVKVRQLRQFMDYYLPTTINLLKNYDELSRERVKGDNIKKTMTRIEDTMFTIVEAFRKELDDLYQDRAIDISVDIEVMQKMMEQEGIGGDSLNLGQQAKTRE